MTIKKGRFKRGNAYFASPAALFESFLTYFL